MRQGHTRLPLLLKQVRDVSETVVIEQDITDKPLVEELVRAGVPRGQIVLTYAGEPPPDLENI